MIFFMIFSEGQKTYEKRGEKVVIICDPSLPNQPHFAKCDQGENDRSMENLKLELIDIKAGTITKTYILH